MINAARVLLRENNYSRDIFQFNGLMNVCALQKHNLVQKTTNSYVNKTKHFHYTSAINNEDNPFFIYIL